MQFLRRNLLHFAGAAATTSTFSRIAYAEGYPTKTGSADRWLPSGGGTDVAARLIGQWLSERLGQPVVIDNRPGAGSTIATEVAARADADGYTLLLVSTAHAINATLYDRLNYDFARDIAPVAGFMRVPNVLVVNPSLPVKSLPEFIEFAKAHPARINVASGGNGTSQHLSGELFKMMTGLNIIHVPYRGAAPALADLVGGQVQVMFGDMPSTLEFIKAGKLRAPCDYNGDTIRGDARSADRERVRAELQIQRLVWHRRAQEHAGQDRGQDQQGTQHCSRRPEDEGATCRIGRHAARRALRQDFARLIAVETAKWAEVVRFSGAKVE